MWSRQHGITVRTPNWPYSKGETLHDSCADFKPYYTEKVEHYRVKKWTGHHHFTTAKRTLVVHDKVKHHEPAPVSHSCTTTSSGSCIRGGEFCPQASYGDTGWDADGTAYVCTGDSTHPHWE